VPSNLEDRAQTVYTGRAAYRRRVQLNGERRSDSPPPPYPREEELPPATVRVNGPGNSPFRGVCHLRAHLYLEDQAVACLILVAAILAAILVYALLRATLGHIPPT
jgi:hypothetical protein